MKTLLQTGSLAVVSVFLVSPVFAHVATGTPHAHPHGHDASLVGLDGGALLLSVVIGAAVVALLRHLAKGSARRVP